MEDRLDSYFADSDSGDEVLVEEDYLEEEIAGWRPEAEDNDDDQVRIGWVCTAICIYC